MPFDALAKEGAPGLANSPKASAGKPAIQKTSLEAHWHNQATGVPRLFVINSDCRGVDMENEPEFESESEYYSRRAAEEHDMAMKAATPEIRERHRHLAAYFRAKAVECGE